MHGHRHELQVTLVALTSLFAVVGCGRATASRVEERHADAGARAPRFVCKDAECVQDRPRQPSDGEWECGEGSGVTVCRGGLAAAGVSPGPREAGWRCGPWRTGDAGPYPEICVDVTPDYPEHPTPHPDQKWGCRYSYVNGLPRRTCVPSAQRRVGDRCAGEGCPRGARCEKNVCVVPQAEVGCFFDRDCHAGEWCAFGSCQRS